jgi:hypothetical protein
MMERLRVLDDARQLKALAEAFLYPERPVVTTDPYSCGRNYYARPSSVPQMMEHDDEEERVNITQEMAALKELAVAYLHPEVSVVTTDDTACGRNYFNRPSATEQESVDEAEERAAIAQDLENLKTIARDYAHPEHAVVTTDSTIYGRNYITRYTALDSDQASERNAVLEDVQALKRLAVDYLHPELAVVTTDDVACGRNYFERASVPQVQSMEEVYEMDSILEEMKSLKLLATDYLHPESPVAVDPCICGRNYFDRATSPQQDVEPEKLNRIMEDMQALKKFAMDYLHPELPISTTDPCACGRNYFDRYSAADMETMEEADDLARAMQELQMLKQLAVDYAHPELAVFTTDETACGRLYFNRACAPQYETQEEAEERACILQDVQTLSKLAVDYAHPELPVVTTDCTCCGRNYFDRYSAVEQMSVEEANEIARCTEDLATLKEYAVEYSHPEFPVVTMDATACGRNYYDRASAKGHDYISTTREESFQIVDEDEEFYLDECDLHYGNFEMDEEMVSDMKYQLHALLEHCHDHHDVMAPIDDDKKEDEHEGKLSRSPSSVMLFGGYEVVV